MAVDYAEKEREFLEGLAADTGRDLAGWMAAISASGLTDRNAIIDWLRRQGFLFAKASWLERIHNNGGRPIYFDAAAIGASAAGPAKREVSPSPSSPVPAAGPSAPPSPPPAVQSTGTVQPTARTMVPERRADAAGHLPLEALLAEAKAYRPLAHMVLREIEKAVPDIVFEARRGFVVITGRNGLAGVLTISAKELRLGLAWPDDAAPSPFAKAKFAKTHPDVPAQISHMVILNDARQVTADLVSAVAHVAGHA